MPRIVTRECPQCHVTKPFRIDCTTCGCPKPKQPKSEDTVSKSGRVRDINIEGTRICTEEQLIEALNIDLKKWYVDSFTVRKWEMGFVTNQTAITTKTDTVTKQTGKKGFKTKRTTGGKISKNKDYTPDHHELFAVSCKLKRVVTEQDNDGYVRENLQLMKANKRLSFQLSAEKRYRTQYVTAQSILDEHVAQIKELAGALADQIQFNPTRLTVPEPQIVPAVGSDHSEDAVALFSDWHCGDVIRPGDTSGFPEFDLPICGNRLGYVIGKMKGILTKHRSMYPIKELTLWFGGDMGNGDLHDAPLSNALFIGPQIDFTYKLAVLVLKDLLTLTEPDKNGVRVVEEIECLFTCGNHMREATSKFMPMKYQAVRTFDGLIYQLLMHWIREQNNPRLKFEEAMSPYIFKDIRGHRYGFAHGMQVGYKNSPDAQCKSMDSFLKTIRSLFDSPEFRRKNGLSGATFSRMCIGDIHVPVDFPRITSNASLNGQNELGANWGLEPIPAGQKLFGVTEKHIQTWGYLVECSQIQKEAGDFNAYGDFALEYEKKFGRR